MTLAPNSDACSGRWVRRRRRGQSGGLHPRSRRWWFAAILTAAAACGETPQYGTTDEVRAALRELDIRCDDFAPSPPAVAACSFHEAVPVSGLAQGVVLLYEHPSHAANVEDGCVTGAGGEQQLLYREGQAWIAMISAVDDDRKTTSRIDDQAFVSRVADALGTGVIECRPTEG